MDGQTDREIDRHKVDKVKMVKYLKVIYCHTILWGWVRRINQELSHFYLC
jgi:hypothetical protein